MQMLWQLFSAFLQIGAFSIGGGYAVIPMIRDQVVIHHGWITQKVFTDIITISQMTPGPLAINTSTFVGLQIAGIPGAMTATLGCVLPGVAAALLLHLFFPKASAFPLHLRHSGRVESGFRRPDHVRGRNHPDADLLRHL